MLGPQQERFMHMTIQSAQNQTKQDLFDTNHTTLNQNFNSLNRPDGLKPKSTYAKKRQNEEMANLKLIVQKLSQSLKEQQLNLSQLQREKHERLGIEYEDPMDLVINPQMVKVGPEGAEVEAELTNQLSHHVLGPLFESYEATIAQMQKELDRTRSQFKSKMEDCQLVVQENDSLRQELEVSKREYLRIVEENRDHAGVVRPNQPGQEGEGPAIGENPGHASSEEIMELKNRAHLLSEENQTLFQKVQVLMAHYDSSKEEHDHKMDEANRKIAMVTKLQNDLHQAILQRDNYGKTNAFLDKKLSITSQKLGALEEGRRQDQSEMKKMKEQFNLINREYEFYKNHSEKLEYRQTDELASLNQNMRNMSETEKDLKQKVEILERENQECQHQNRQLIGDLQRMQRDLKSIMAVNEEYQMQTQQFKERESQYSDLGREYREKLEAVKFERERIALKEEQFLRQIQKAEGQTKIEIRRQQEKQQSQLHTRKRDYDKKLEELEERMMRSMDEADQFKRKNEKLDREAQDLKKQLDTYIQKEDRTITQYEKIMDQLKSEIKDKERQCHTIETREAYARQELSQKNKELQMKADDTKDQVLQLSGDLKQKDMVIDNMREKYQKNEIQLQAMNLSQSLQRNQQSAGENDGYMNENPIRLYS